MRLSLLLACLVSAAASPALASTITFDDMSGPSFFDQTTGPQTVLYSIGTLDVTFNGGVILTVESNQSSDFTSVYATGSWQVPALSDISHGFENPLVIDFSAPIQNLQLDILNALAGDYELFDNAGNSLFFRLTTTGDVAMTEGFAATGSEVSLLYLTAPNAWDFAIDNVTFDEPLTVPEPSAWLLTAAGLTMMLRRYRFRRIDRY